MKILRLDTTLNSFKENKENTWIKLDNITEEKLLKKKQIGVTEDEYKKFLVYWEKVLKDFFENKKFDLKSSAERNIRTSLVIPAEAGIQESVIPITWKIDRIDILESWEVKVVDYKTWKFRKEKFLPASEDFEIWNFEKSEFKKLWWDYWRQAVFYKILFDQDIYSKFSVNNIWFEFVEDKDNFEKIVNIWNDDVEKLKKQISEVWQKIKTHQFHVWCEDENCFWCNFKNGLEN